MKENEFIAHIVEQTSFGVGKSSQLTSREIQLLWANGAGLQDKTQWTNRIVRSQDIKTRLALSWELIGIIEREITPNRMHLKLDGNIF